jgi:hypothetical protein
MDEKDKTESDGCAYSGNFAFRKLSPLLFRISSDTLMPTPPPYYEPALLSRLAAGETDAFAAVYTHYQPDLQRFLLLFLKSPDLAADCCQDVFHQGQY